MSDESIAVVVPSLYKDRRRWLVVFGICEVLIACCLLLLLIVASSAVGNLTQQLSDTPPLSRPAMVVMVVMLAVVGLAALFFIAVGIGSIRARSWARLTMVVVGWIWLAIGVAGMAITALLLPVTMAAAKQQASTLGVDETAFTASMWWATVSMAVPSILVPLVFVLFYSGKHVKATCEHSSRNTRSAVGTPVSVMVVAAMFALGALVSIGLMFLRPPTPLFGIVVRGWAVGVYMVLTCGASVWLAWNLCRQRTLAWRLAVGWVVFGSASMAVTQLWLGSLGLPRGASESQIEVTVTSSANYGPYLAHAIQIAWLMFLLSIRKKFNQPMRVPSTLT